MKRVVNEVKGSSERKKFEERQDDGENVKRSLNVEPKREGDLGLDKALKSEMETSKRYLSNHLNKSMMTHPL